MSKPDDMDPEAYADWLKTEPGDALNWLKGRIQELGDTPDAFAMRAMFFLVLMSLGIREMLSTGDPEFVMQHLSKLSLSMDDRIDEMLNEYMVAALVYGD